MAIAAENLAEPESNPALQKIVAVEMCRFFTVNHKHFNRSIWTSAPIR